MQLANTQPLQSTAPGLDPVSIHQMSPLVRWSKHPITAYYSIYRPRKDEKLSRPGWLVTNRNKVPPPGVEPGRITHPSTNRARRRVTSLIRPTLLPLRHAATAYVPSRLSCWMKRERKEESAELQQWKDLEALGQTRKNRPLAPSFFTITRLQGKGRSCVNTSSLTSVFFDMYIVQ